MKGWRTITANTVAALPIIADTVAVFNQEGLGDIMPDAYLPYYTLAVILANVYLRSITTTPVGRKDRAMGFLAWLGRILTGGVLDRVLDTVDKRIEVEENRDKIKGDLLKTHMQTRGDFMRSGGFVLMLLFAVPLAVWFSGVVIYSILWCADCAYPQSWTIAALPHPLDQWAGAIVVSIFGVVGLDRFKR